MVYKEYKAPNKLSGNCNQPIGATEKPYGFWFCDLY